MTIIIIAACTVSGVALGYWLGRRERHHDVVTLFRDDDTAERLPLPPNVRWRA